MSLFYLWSPHQKSYDKKQNLDTSGAAPPFHQNQYAHPYLCKPEEKFTSNNLTEKNTNIIATATPFHFTHFLGGALSSSHHSPLLHKQIFINI